MKSLLRGAVSLLIFAGTAAAPAMAAPLTNGGFESGLSGWSSLGNVDPVNYTLYGITNKNPILGNNAVVFNSGDSTPDGVLSQTFSTQAFQTYEVTFYYGNLNASGSTSLQQILAQVSDASSADILGLMSATQISSSNSQDQAVIYGLGNPYHLFFTAESASTVLSFSDQAANTDGTDGFLDNVSVQAVPEINTSVASIPLAIALSTLLLVSDRRKIRHT